MMEVPGRKMILREGDTTQRDSPMAGPLFWVVSLWSVGPVVGPQFISGFWHRKWVVNRWGWHRN